jgi:hypothetical protein
MSQKKYKTRAKKGKTKNDKKTKSNKGEKTIKTKSKKRKRGREKNLTKGNKRTELKIKVLTYELTASTLSYLMLAPW